MKSIKEIILEKKLSLSIIILYCAVCGFFITLILIDYDYQESIVKEDGYMEWMEVIFYGVASALFLYLCLKLVPKSDFPRLGKIFYIGFFLLFFIIMMEEISWGQRIFNFETPEDLREVNYQDETTIHNIGGEFEFYLYIGLGIFLFTITLLFPILNLTINRFRGFITFNAVPVVQKNLINGFALSSLFYYQEHAISNSIFFGICIHIPLVLTLILRKNEKMKFLDFPLLTSLIIFLMGLIIIYITFLPKNHEWMLYEIREFLYGLSFLIFGILLVFAHHKEDATFKKENSNSDQHNSI